MSTPTIPSQKNCAECDRLWDDYTLAAAAHVKIVARRHKASLRSDSTVLAEIAAMEGDAGQREMKARRAIAEHEAEHEPV